MSEILPKIAAKLLKQADLPPEIDCIAPLAGGGNNRAYHVDTPSASFLLKAYYHHPDDPRNRLHHEFSFSTLLNDNNITQIARPVAADPESHHALYEFICGPKLAPDQVDTARVLECADFFVEINEIRAIQAAQPIPNASEASFSVENHLLSIKNRLNRLKNSPVELEIDQQAADFVQHKLEPAAEGVFETIEMSKLSRARILEAKERCLSPSDFGFHNAIIADDGRLHFIDFEYAGWDDPAKMVGDFFSQPAISAPLEYCRVFVDRILQHNDYDAQVRLRIQLLLPLYRIKWCCIILNEFLQGEARRRQQALGTDPEERKQQQLSLARTWLAGLAALKEVKL